MVSLTDLHVQDSLFCRAQDLLQLYEESPALVRREELAEVVRGGAEPAATSARANATRGRTAQQVGR